MLGYSVFRLIPGALRSRHWPKAPGFVERRERPSFWFGLLTDDGPRLVFRYTYEVDGTTHSGRRVFFGDDLVRTVRDDTTETYPAGSTVTVHHHPSKPWVSVLEPGWHREITVPLVLGVVFLVLGIVAAGTWVT